MAYQDWVATTVYNNPAIQFPSVGTYPALTIPLHLTDSKIPSRTPTVTQSNLIPTWATDPSDGRLFDNSVVGGFVLGLGTLSLPKIELQGWIDTPMTTSIINGQLYELPAYAINTPNGQVLLTYGEVAALYIEGEMNVSSTDRRAVQPAWYRDQAGRQYNSPRIIEYQPSFIEGVPGRVNFQMTLQI